MPKPIGPTPALSLYVQRLLNVTLDMQTIKCGAALYVHLRGIELAYLTPPTLLKSGDGDVSLTSTHSYLDKL